MAKQCRICFEDTVSNKNQLIEPCACKGSSRYIHQLCLNYWIRIDPDKNGKRCPVCMGYYRFSLMIKEVIPREPTLSLIILDKAFLLGCLTHYGVVVMFIKSRSIPVTEMKMVQFFFNLAFHVSYSINCNIVNKELYRGLLKRSYMPLLVLIYSYLSYDLAVYSNVLHCFTLSFILNLIWREHIRILSMINIEAE